MTKPVTLGPWPKGIDNRQPEHSLGSDVVRNAVNVDFDNSGRARRRGGVTKKYSGVGTHSLFSCDVGTFFVERGVLKKLSSNLASATTVKTGIVGAWAACQINGEVYWSDEAQVGKINSSGVAAELGVDPPSTPELLPISGSIPAGRYTVFTTAELSTGEESGASEAVQIELVTSAGIQVSVGAHSTATYLNVFVTSTNGEMFYYEGRTTPSGAVSLSSLSENGRGLYPMYFGKMPPGNIVRYYRGRLYIVSGSVVWYSEPFAFGRCRRQANFIQYPAALTLFEPVTNGIWVCSESQTWFLAGANPEEFVGQQEFNYGAVLGTGVKVPNSNDVMWLSTRGICRGDEHGEVSNLQEKHVAVNPGTSGTALIREQNGLRQFIASYAPSGTSPLAASDWMEAEIIRKSS